MSCHDLVIQTVIVENNGTKPCGLRGLPTWVPFKLELRTRLRLESGSEKVTIKPGVFPIY